MVLWSYLALCVGLIGLGTGNAKLQGPPLFSEQPQYHGLISGSPQHRYFVSPLQQPPAQMRSFPRPMPFKRPQKPDYSAPSYLSPQMESCPGSCPHTCAPDCNWKCCFPPVTFRDPAPSPQPPAPPPPPPPPPCPASCPKRCHPECNKACCKHGPPPYDQFSERAEKTAVSCQGKKLKIKCKNRSERIVLYSTFYGRKDDTICHHKVLPSTGTCIDQEMNINQKIHDLCSGVNRCTVAANNAFLAKKGTVICPGKYKYLRVTYKCTQHPELFEACPLPCAKVHDCWPNCSPKCCTPVPPPPPPAPHTCPGDCPNSCFASGCSKRCCIPPAPPIKPVTRFVYTRNQIPQFYPPHPVVANAMEKFAPNPPYTPRFLEFPPKVQTPPQPQYQNQFQNPYTGFRQPIKPNMSICQAPCPIMCAPACSKSCCATGNTRRNLIPQYRRYYGRYYG